MIHSSCAVRLSLVLLMTLAAACAGPGPSAAAKVVEPDTRLLQGHSGQLFTLAFSPDSLTLASGGSDQTIRLWELATGRERKALRGHGGSVLGLAFAPNGQWLASASADGTIRIRDPLQGRERKALAGRFGAFRGVAFAPDGRTVVSAGVEGAIRLWDEEGKYVTREQGHGPAHAWEPAQRLLERLAALFNAGCDQG